jgi:hypothetical protein
MLLFAGLESECAAATIIMAGRLAELHYAEPIAFITECLNIGKLDPFYGILLTCELSIFFGRV